MVSFVFPITACQVCGVLLAKLWPKGLPSVNQLTTFHNAWNPCPVPPRVRESGSAYRPFGDRRALEIVQWVSTKPLGADSSFVLLPSPVLNLYPLTFGATEAVPFQNIISSAQAKLRNSRPLASFFIRV